MAHPLGHEANLIDTRGYTFASPHPIILTPPVSFRVTLPKGNISARMDDGGAMVLQTFGPWALAPSSSHDDLGENPGREGSRGSRNADRLFGVVHLRIPHLGFRDSDDGQSSGTTSLFEYKVRTSTRSQ